MLCALSTLGRFLDRVSAGSFPPEIVTILAYRVTPCQICPGSNLSTSSRVSPIFISENTARRLVLSVYSTVCTAVPTHADTLLLRYNLGRNLLKFSTSRVLCLGAFFYRKLIHTLFSFRVYLSIESLLIILFPYHMRTFLRLSINY